MNAPRLEASPLTPSHTLVHGPAPPEAGGVSSAQTHSDMRGGNGERLGLPVCRARPWGSFIFTA
eukprot:scaffold14791_cov131-Isochrysis_galbana.AAC.3